MTDDVPQIIFGLGNDSEYVVMVGEEETEATTLANLLSLAPGLKQPEASLETARAINYLSQGPAFRIIEDPAAHIDLMPTIVAAANVSLPQDRIIDGVNLMPVAEGGGEIERENDAIFWQSGYVRVVRAGNWKLQVDGRQQKSWLFDLENDPTEQINLADSRLDKLDELQALLDAHAANAREPLYPYLLESPIRIDKTVDQPISLDDEYVWWPN